MTMSKMFLALPLMTGLVAAGVPALAHAQDSAPAATTQGNAPGTPGMHGPHDGPHGPMHCGPGSPFMHLDGITLSADQKKKLHAIMEANRPADPKAAMEQMHGLHKQIRPPPTRPGQAAKAQMPEPGEHVAVWSK